MLIHLVWNLLLFSIILLGPIPLALSFIQERYKYPISPPSLRDGEAATIALDLLCLWCIVQISLGLCLGSLHQFFIAPVLLIELVLASIGFILLRRSTSVNINFYKQFSTTLKTQLKSEEAWVIAAITFVGIILFERVATQPFINYDTLWFHGPLLARWYQTGSFTQLDHFGNWIIDHPFAEVYPYSWSVLSVFFVLPFHQDFLAAFPMLLSWIMMGLAIYLLGINFGAKHFYALSSSALVLFAPFILNQVTTLHVDLPLAAVCVVCFHYLVAYQTSQCAVDTFLFWTMVGTLAGVKNTGVIYTAALAILFIFLWVSRRSQVNSHQSKHLLHLLTCSFSLFLGCFWYLKFFLGHEHLITENLRLDLFLSNQTTLVATAYIDSLLPSPIQQWTAVEILWRNIIYLQRETLTSQFNPINLVHWSLLSSQALIRFQLPLIALGSQVLLIPLAWWKELKSKQSRNTITVFLAFLVFFAMYWNTPFSAAWGMTPEIGNSMRYGFPAFGMLGVVAAVNASKIQVNKACTTSIVVIAAVLGVFSSAMFDKVRAQRVTEYTFFCLQCLANNLYRAPFRAIQDVINLIQRVDMTDVILYLLVFATLIIVLISAKLFPKFFLTFFDLGYSKFQQVFLISLLVFLLLGSISNLETMRDINRHKRYKGIYEIIEKTVKPGESIAYFSSHQNYLLYGRNLDQSVVHIWPQSNDINVWLEQLNQVNASLVAIDLNLLNLGSYYYEYDSVKNGLATLIDSQGTLVPILGEGSKTGVTLFWLDQYPEKSPDQ